MPEPLELFLSIAFGITGCGFAAYGRRQDNVYFLLCGIALTLYSFVVTGAALLVAVGVALVVAPFLMTKYL